MSDNAIGTSGVRTAVPRPAVWLGAAGALPFVLGASLMLVLDGAAALWAGLAVKGYGAVILSFLGGVHWGLAMADETRAPGAGATCLRLCFSVVPALVGWLAYLMPGPLGLLILAFAFAALLAGDQVATRRGLAPAWYPRLRWPLTAVVVLSLLGGSFG